MNTVTIVCCHDNRTDLGIGSWFGRLGYWQYGWFTAATGCRGNGIRDDRLGIGRRLNYRR